MEARALQICGTGSGVGKSVIVSALCRVFLQDGYKVCPFKAQNMALNSFVTKEGGEIGRAQAVQAQACRIEPTTDMNPVLIKPSSDIKAQIIVQGKPVGNMNAQNYVRYKSKLSATVKESFKRLSCEYEVAVIEGAGSPAEINLKSHDIVNMKMAKFAKAPVILVGDIDKGGVFASFVGTLELLDKEERKMIKGFIINKFRGDIALLKGGIDFLEKRTGVKVLGVIPYYKDIFIPEEDSVPLDYPLRNKPHLPKRLNINVIYLPHISNFTDFDPLEREPDVNLRYINKPAELANPDVIIIPGTKNTFADLTYLRKSGLSDKIIAVIRGTPKITVIGICGGFQILGRKIRDAAGIESRQKEIDGLGVLEIATDFKKEKILSQVKAEEIKSGLRVYGYEIRHGRTKSLKEYGPVFRIIERQGKKTESFDGAAVRKGNIWGTYIHGVFDSDIFRRYFLNKIRRDKRLPPLTKTTAFNVDEEIDKLAKLVRENTNMKLLRKILKGG
ncbi:MAG: cobyric acid synthase [Candidatus Omnitrophica bacterium]|nr:cobyric acid synthase [Candidatus Omnitrophota bacterium]